MVTSYLYPTPVEQLGDTQREAANDNNANDAANIDPRAYKAIRNRRTESIQKALQGLPAAKLQLNPLDYMTARGVSSPTALSQEKPTLGASKTYWYHCDHLGTPQELTDEQGNLVWAASYAAWGGIKKYNALFAFDPKHNLTNTLAKASLQAHQKRKMWNGLSYSIKLPSKPE